MYVNIRSIKKNIDKLILTLDLMKKKPEVIVCTEAWLQQKINFIDIPGYDQYNNNEYLNQNDGVVMYIKNDLIYSISNEKYGELSLVSATINLKRK